MFRLEIIQTTNLVTPTLQYSVYVYKFEGNRERERRERSNHIGRRFYSRFENEVRTTDIASFISRRGPEVDAFERFY